MAVRVLFVDDEEHILTALVRRLRHAESLDVMTATSGEQAIALLAQGRVDVLVSDLMMPLMGGNELLAFVAERYPLIRRIILSGTTSRVPMPHAHAVLAKPCTMQDLVNAIRNGPLSTSDQH